MHFEFFGGHRCIEFFFVLRCCRYFFVMVLIILPLCVLMILNNVILYSHIKVVP